MNSKTAIPKKGCNAMPIRRRVRREFSTSDGVTGFIAKSFTRPDDAQMKAPEHHPAIDVLTGEVRCTCEHFQFKLARLHPDLRRQETWCKHIRRAVEGMVRGGELRREVLHPTHRGWVIAFAPNHQCFIFTDAALVPDAFGVRYEVRGEAPEVALRALMSGTFERRICDVRIVRDTTRHDAEIWEAIYREETAVDAPNWMQAAFNR